MARGWESKSVEEQIQSARESRPGTQKQPSPQQIERERRRDSILLQRRRVLNEIETCTSDRHRKTLESGLAYLESQLALIEA
jgi:hypothetical protein